MATESMRKKKIKIIHRTKKLIIARSSPKVTVTGCKQSAFMQDFHISKAHVHGFVISHFSPLCSPSNHWHKRWTLFLNQVD